MSCKSLKIGDFDVDLLGQIGIQTSKMLALSLKIEPFTILPFNINYSLVI